MTQQPCGDVKARLGMREVKIGGHSERLPEHPFDREAELTGALPPGQVEPDVGRSFARPPAETGYAVVEPGRGQVEYRDEREGQMFDQAPVARFEIRIRPGT